MDAANAAPADAASDLAAPDAAALYIAGASTFHFTRSLLTHQGPQIDPFFDRFVPLQYDEGFVWRCRVIGGDETNRILAFAEQPPWMQQVIAGNAEVLLELYTESGAGRLDLMRLAGKQLLELQALDPEVGFDGDMLILREDMQRKHHAKWLKNLHDDLAAKRRPEQYRDHRGNKPYEDLPPIEQTILKVQTWANWRILAVLSEADYQLIRDVATTQQRVNEMPAAETGREVQQ